MARCLVLGANGFIGSHIVDALASRGHFVRCFDRYKSNTINFEQSEGRNIERYHGDFLSTMSLEKALEDIEYVLHFISTTNPIISEKEPRLDIETNIKCSVELFDLCVKKKVRRIVFASTGGAIYGEHPEIEGPLSEDVATRPFSPYAIGKLTIENYLRFFGRKYGLDHLILRISNPYGPRQNTLSGQGVIATFLEHAKNDTPITVYGDGSMIRDYVYIEDVVKATCTIFDKEKKHSVYNIGSGVGHTILEVASAIEAVTGKNLQKVFVKSPTSFVKNVVLDTKRLETEFHVQCDTTLETGIQNTWKKIQ